METFSVNVISGCRQSGKTARLVDAFIDYATDTLTDYELKDRKILFAVYDFAAVQCLAERLCNGVLTEAVVNGKTTTASITDTLNRKLPYLNDRLVLDLHVGDVCNLLHNKLTVADPSCRDIAAVFIDDVELGEFNNCFKELYGPNQLAEVMITFAVYDKEQDALEYESLAK